MSQWKNINLKLPKLSDLQLFEAFKKIFDASEFSFVNANFQFASGGPAVTQSPENLGQNEELAEILKQDAELISIFTFQFDHGLNLTVQREEQGHYDRFMLNLNSFNSDPALGEDEQVRINIRALLGLSQTHFKLLHTRNSLAALIGDEAKSHFEAREAELLRLEKISEKTLNSITSQAAKLRSQLESEFNKRQKVLEKEHEAARQSLEDKHETKDQALNEREEFLNAKIKEIDDRESKHVRRTLREDLKKQLEKRSERFELTKGTVGLRKPIYRFTLALLAFFGIGLAAFSYLSFEQFSKETAASTTEIITLSLKQLAFALGFGSTAIFFIRWNNQWFRQHAREEFRLKRLDLDLDRASWVVEMALEWSDEKGTEIPKELVERLTANLFVDDDIKEEALHPADQLASALLGASANANLKLPGGNELTFDRKSIKKLKRDETSKE